MPTNPIELDYLFTVLYKDGNTYQQTPEDVSVSDPLKSCFFDIKQDEVKTFTLKGNGHTYLVSLEDGHFEIDGVSFKNHDEVLTNFRLIFFRRHRHNFNVQYE